MEMNEIFLAAWGIIQAGLVAPVVDKLKKWLPGNFPIQPVFYSALLTFGVGYLLAMALQPELPLKELILWACAGHVVTQASKETVWKGKK